MSDEKKKILVAMSGGVDSSVAAGLLLEQGHEVAGATIRTWASNSCADTGTKACCGIVGVEDSEDVAATLGISHWVFNFEKEFKEKVIDYFASEYLKGRTPNPCIACNEHIKFRLFLKRAQEMGFDAIATGHYASVDYSKENDKYFLKTGKDSHKDQSYVLFPLGQDILSKLYLPCGEYTKDEIRQKAEDLKLSVSNKPDSQEICFIPNNDYGDFMKREFSEETKRIKSLEKEGLVKHIDGRVLGKHEGYYNYTLGQRRGLKIPHSEKLYVVNILPEENEVIVGSKEDVLGSRLRASSVNWLIPPSEETIDVHVKIRSQHQMQPAILTVLDDENVEVVFCDPQESITPGQAAVFYQNGDVIGGGWICHMDPQEKTA